MYRLTFRRTQDTDRLHQPVSPYRSVGFSSRYWLVCVLKLILTISFCFALLDVSVSRADEPITSEADGLEVTYSVEYATYDERDLKGKVTGRERKLLTDIYLPKGEGPFPTVLMVHGGAWFSGNKAHVTLHARDVAKAGYAVVAINYRLAPSYKFPAQLHDLRKGLSFIQQNADRYRFDTKRVAGYGYSAGAHLVALLGVTQNEPTKLKGQAKDLDRDLRPDQQPTKPLPKLAAVVAGGAPCEFSWIPSDSQRLAFWLGGSREDRPEAYRAASPISFVDAEDPPTCFFHGTKDQIVPLESARTLEKLLAKQGVTTEFQVIPGADHLRAFINPKSRSTAIQFLDRHLGDAAKN